MDRVMLAVAFLVLATAIPAKATTYYYAATAQGSNNGTSCANAWAYNDSSNGISTSGKDVAGNVLYICGGTWSLSAGANVVTLSGGGSSGNVLEIELDPTAVIQAPYFSGAAIELNGQNYVLVDGGNPCGTGTSCSANLSGTGTIEATSSGTSGTYQQYAFAGVDFGPSNNCGHDIEVRNLIVANIYVRTANSTDDNNGAESSGGIGGVGCGNNISIHDNTSTWAHANIYVWTGSSSSISNWSIYNNVTANSTWGIVAAINFSSQVVSNLLIYNNDINDGAGWNEPSDEYHIDGIFVYGQGPTGYINGGYIYNNRMWGNWGNCSYVTAYAYINQNLTNFYLFNNVFDNSAWNGAAPCGNGDLALGYGDTNFYIYNNTFLGYSSSPGGMFANDTGGGDTGMYLSNNIFAYAASALWMPSSSSPIAVDYNDYYDITGSGVSCAWGISSSCVSTGGSSSFSTWQGDGYDTHGTYANPNLNSSYIPQSGSAAISLGTNLYSTCNGQPNPGLGALCYDRAGNQRPSSGAWDAGAYSSGSGSTSAAPAAPTGLTATVQ